MTRFNNLLKCEDPADGLSLNALLTSSSAGITKKEKTMKWALALALGLIVCLPCMAATAASTSCDSVSTPNRQVNEETVRRIEQNWITAECLLEPDYRTSGRSGQVRTRQDVIDHVSLTTDISKPILPFRQSCSSSVTAQLLTPL